MRVTKYGHSCLLVEDKARVLIDPGVWSGGFEELEGLDAILITHQHQDHVSPEKLQGLLEKNPAVRIYADEQSVEVLQKRGIRAQAVHDGDRLDIVGTSVEVFGTDHAVIHPQLPPIRNVGYLVAGRLFHPGDSHTVPRVPVEVLAVPLVAPWTNIGQTVDYVLALKPRLVVPIHDAITGMPEIYEGTLSTLIKPVGVSYQPLVAGEGLEV